MINNLHSGNSHCTTVADNEVNVLHALASYKKPGIKLMKGSCTIGMLCGSSLVCIGTSINAVTNKSIHRLTCHFQPVLCLILRAENTEPEKRRCDYCMS